MADTSFEFRGKQYQLKRYPHLNKSQLRAWDTADSYLLAETLPYLNEDTKLCIVHDNFGALTLPLIQHQPICYGDSWMSRKAIENNLDDNQLSSHRFVSNLQALPENNDKPNLIVGRVPKLKSQLAYLLQQLNQWAQPETVLLLSGMDKHLSKGQYDLLQQNFGPSEFLPGVKKARVWKAVIDKNLDLKPIKSNKIEVPEYDLSLVSGPNVFSQDKLDIGSRFFLEHFSKLPEKTEVADLACGNGVLGLAYLNRYPTSNMLFCDESFQAVQSTEQNIAHNAVAANTRVLADDGLQNAPPASLDLVLCNPPFHQQNVISTEIAFGLFKGAKKALRKSGELWIVANRHLGYHVVLKRLFGNCSTEASNKKFVILKAIKD